MQYSPLFNIIASYTAARLGQKLGGFNLEYISFASLKTLSLSPSLSLALPSLTWYSLPVCTHVGEKHANIHVSLGCVQKGEVFAFGTLFGSAPS